jgi:prepilin-type N-terminal cleavage/methylation domain-containing protein
MTPCAVLQRLRSEQSGFSLIELLVVMPLALLIMFVALSASDTAGRSQSASTERAQAITQAQVGLERMVREIRQAASFKLLTSQVVEVETFVRSPDGTQAGGYAGGLRLVRYDCTQKECRRYEGPRGGPLGATATRLFTDVINADVFSPQPNFLNPTSLGVKVEIAVQGQTRPITVTDGVDLRNYSTGQ